MDGWIDGWMDRKSLITVITEVVASFIVFIHIVVVFIIWLDSAVKPSYFCLFYAGWLSVQCVRINLWRQLSLTLQWVSNCYNNNNNKSLNNWLTQLNSDGMLLLRDACKVVQVVMVPYDGRMAIIIMTNTHSKHFFVHI